MTESKLEQSANPEPEKWYPGKKIWEGTKEVGKAIKDNPGHSVVGAVIGQILLPIPGVGLAAGAAVGGWVGKKNDPAQN